MEGKLARIETSDGLLLNGFIFPKRGSKKVVLHVPGMGSNFYDDRNFVHMARELNKAGWSFFTVNNRGHDVISDIPTTRGIWKRYGTAFENFPGCVNDIGAAVDFAWRLGYRKIVLSGHSTGCQKVTYYKSRTQDRRVRALILLGPVDDYNSMQLEFGKSRYRKLIEMSRRAKNKRRVLPHSMTNGYIFSVERFLSAHDPRSVEAGIFNYNSKMKIFRQVRCPILAVFGSRDEFRVKPVEKNFSILRRNTGSAELECVQVRDANHSFVGKERELARKVAKWVRNL